MPWYAQRTEHAVHGAVAFGEKKQIDVELEVAVTNLNAIGGARGSKPFAPTPRVSTPFNEREGRRIQHRTWRALKYQ